MINLNPSIGFVRASKVAIDAKTRLETEKKIEKYNNNPKNEHDLEKLKVAALLPRDYSHNPKNEHVLRGIDLYSDSERGATGEVSVESQRSVRELTGEYEKKLQEHRLEWKQLDSIWREQCYIRENGIAKKLVIKEVGPEAAALMPKNASNNPKNEQAVRGINLYSDCKRGAEGEVSEELTRPVSELTGKYKIKLREQERIQQIWNERHEKRKNRIAKKVVINEVGAAAAALMPKIPPHHFRSKDFKDTNCPEIVGRRRRAVSCKEETEMEHPKSIVANYEAFILRNAMPSPQKAESKDRSARFKELLSSTTQTVSSPEVEMGDLLCLIGFFENKVIENQAKIKNYKIFSENKVIKNQAKIIRGSCKNQEKWICLVIGLLLNFCK